MPVHSGTYRVDWGDGSAQSSIPGVKPNIPIHPTHQYAAPGSYDIIVTGPPHLVATVTITVVAATPGTSGEVASYYLKTESDGEPLEEARPFPLYLLSKCRTVGAWGEAKARAERVFANAEGKAVEAQIIPDILDEADDLTPPSGAVDIVDGLGILERFAGAWYNGRPTVIMPRQVGTLLSSRDAIDRYGDHLETKQGSLVASATGWNGDYDTATDTAYMLITGLVMVRRGPTFSTEPQLVRQPVTNNEFRVLVERQYAVSWECFAAKVKVLVQPCCPVNVTVSEPAPRAPAPATMHVAELVGPGNWVVPANTTQVGVTVQAGSVEINGQDLTAPFSASWDADSTFIIGGTLSLTDPADKALVTWVTQP
jgi:hypothetical protein